MSELTIRISGEAGQGMQTIGEALCRIAKNAGYHIFANLDNMSRIRGGNNYFQLRIADSPLYCLRQKADIIVSLDAASPAIHKKDLAKGGVMVADRKKFPLSSGSDAGFFDAPLYTIATEIAGKEIAVNAVACGLVCGIVRIDFKYLETMLRVAFSRKEEDIITKNIAAAQAGYDYARKNFKGSYRIKPAQAGNNLVMDGNDAIALGAIKSGCKFYSAYPMSPSTPIMNVMAEYAKDFDIVVEQAEDEIAAMNMIIGASFAGVRSMAATSGGGFALMVEGLSLAGMTETPIVVAVCQRPGPATGFPTRTEQADLEFVLSAGHGEFARVVYTPGTIEQAFHISMKAFRIAEQYQVPVLILSDQHLSESYRDIPRFDVESILVKRYVIPPEESKTIQDYKRYALTESGISPRAIPSWINGFVYADSDEHTEEGHITEDADTRVKMVEKRLYKKMKALETEIEEPSAYNIKGAQSVLVGFGSTFGVLKEAVDTLKGQAGFVHLSQVWPFPAASISRVLKDAPRIITVENNASGQLRRLIRSQTGIAADSSILKYDGRPFDIDYLVEQVKEKG